MSEWKETEIGLIPKDWEVAELGKIADVTKLAGFEFTEYIEYIEGGEIIALRALNVRNGELDLNDVKTISKNASDSLVRSKLYKNDILFTYVGANIGQFALVDADDKYHLAPNICRIRVSNEFYTYFLFSYFRTETFKKIVNKYVVGSSQPTLPMKNIRQITVPYPSKAEQKQIADILSCLDNKIDNLRRQNETLETIAQTLFKHWFIDFEFPNDDGKPYKSSGGAMVASELGDIPEGWRVGKLGEVADITSSKRIFQSEYQDSGVPFYRSKEIIELSLGQSISTELYISLEKFNEIKEKFSIPQEGDILLTSVGTIGISYIVRKNDYFYFKDGNLTWIKNFRNGFNGILIYFWLKDELTQQQIKVSTIGSTQKALTIQALNNLTLIIYNPLVLSKLIPFFVPIYRKIEQNTNQIQTLTKTRDTLLPKLMSGQIRVKEGESIIEEE
ncbi:MAG: restriction endonuclease subunit S [Planktothrix sp.]|uniref:restriction endonuclease subunit S n=1 Tax=Planktothrix sp. TaxID=3088171 RepID=UPI0038D45B63